MTNKANIFILSLLIVLFISSKVKSQEIIGIYGNYTFYNNEVVVVDGVGKGYWEEDQANNRFSVSVVTYTGGFLQAIGDGIVGESKTLNLVELNYGTSFSLSIKKGKSKERKKKDIEKRTTKEQYKKVHDLIDKGANEFKKDNYQNALDFFNEALSISKDNRQIGFIYSWIGDVYYYMEDYNKSVTYYNKSLSIDETSQKIKNDSKEQLIKSYIKLYEIESNNDFELSMSYLQEILNISPHNYYAAFTSGQNYFLKNNYLLADEYINKSIIDINEGFNDNEKYASIKSFFMKSITQFKLGNLDSAESNFIFFVCNFRFTFGYTDFKYPRDSLKISKFFSPDLLQVFQEMLITLGYTDKDLTLLINKSIAKSPEAVEIKYIKQNKIKQIIEYHVFAQSEYHIGGIKDVSDLYNDYFHYSNQKKVSYYDKNGLLLCDSISDWHARFSDDSRRIKYIDNPNFNAFEINKYFYDENNNLIKRYLIKNNTYTVFIYNVNYNFMFGHNLSKKVNVFYNNYADTHIPYYEKEKNEFNKNDSIIQILNPDGVIIKSNSFNDSNEYLGKEFIYNSKNQLTEIIDTMGFYKKRINYLYKDDKLINKTENFGEKKMNYEDVNKIIFRYKYKNDNLILIEKYENKRLFELFFYEYVYYKN